MYLNDIKMKCCSDIKFLHLFCCKAVTSMSWFDDKS